MQIFSFTHWCWNRNQHGCECRVFFKADCFSQNMIFPLNTSDSQQLLSGVEQPVSMRSSGLQTDLSRMVGYRPCQLQQPCALVVLLLVRFCCWYCWMEVVLLAEAEETSFLVGKSSAAIIFQSDCRPGHGRSGAGLNFCSRSSWTSDGQSLESSTEKCHVGSRSVTVKKHTRPDLKPVD